MLPGPNFSFSISRSLLSLTHSLRLRATISWSLLSLTRSVCTRRYRGLCSHSLTRSVCTRRYHGLCFHSLTHSLRQHALGRWAHTHCRGRGPVLWQVVLISSSPAGCCFVCLLDQSRRPPQTCCFTGPRRGSRDAFRSLFLWQKNCAGAFGYEDAVSRSDTHKDAGR